MRSLHADGRSRRAIWFLLIPAVVLAAWTAWFLGARVSRYEVTDRAWLEVDQDVHVLQAPVAGRVISSQLVMGREVKAGDVLLEIDAGPGSARRRMLAPVPGRIGEVAIPRDGGVVSEGERLGTVTSGQLRVIAEFPPAAALGRIRPGQPAQWRIEGSTQSGGIATRVTSVGREVHDGTVRVELAIDPPTTFLCGTACQGSVEIQVESVSPATLLLRAIGHTQ